MENFIFCAVRATEHMGISNLTGKRLECDK